MVALDDVTRRALLAREGPPPHARAEVLAGLRGRLGGGPGSDGTGGDGDGLDPLAEIKSASTSVGGAVSSLPWAAKVVAATVGLASAGVLTLALGARVVGTAREPVGGSPELADAHARGVASPVAELPTTDPSAPAGPEPASSPEPESPRMLEATRANGLSSGVTAPTGTGTERSSSSLAAELELVRAAERLRANDPAAALDSLERHLEWFPAGVLAPERDVAIGFAVFAERWRWQLDAGYLTPRVLSLADGRRGRVQGWWLGTRGCVVPRLGQGRRPVELPLCPGVEAGQLFARGIAPTRNSSSRRQPWAAVVVGQGLRWPVVEHLALTADLAITIGLTRGAFAIGDQALTRHAPVGARGSLGVEARF